MAGTKYITVRLIENFIESGKIYVKKNYNTSLQS